MNTAIAPAPAPAPISMFSTAEMFDLAQRQAKLIASSDLVPKAFQGNIANCAIALEMASRLGASPFAVIQNLDVIHGRPSWRSVFLMGLVNNCGRFTPIQFKLEVTGSEREVELSWEAWDPTTKGRKILKTIIYKYTPTRCIAWAKERTTGEIIEGPPVSYDMAIEEGWVAKEGSKWQTEMRELMLRYRAAAFFAKVYASDVMLGMQTSEEVIDANIGMRNVTPVTPVAAPEAAVDPIAAAFTSRVPAAEPAQVVVDQAGPVKKRAKKEVAEEPVAEEPAAELQPTQEDEEPEQRGELDPEESDLFQVEPSYPPRAKMVQEMSAVIKEQKMTLVEAERRFREAGVLTSAKLSATEDEELYKCYSAMHLITGQV